jgi:hypothetical protein
MEWSFGWVHTKKKKIRSDMLQRDKKQLLSYSEDLLSTAHRPRYCSLSQAMMTKDYWDNLWSTIINLTLTAYSTYDFPLLNLKASAYRSFTNLNSKIKIDWLIIYCFMSLSRIFHLCEDITITDEGLQNLGLCSALRVFEKGGIFIVPHLLWHGASVFPVSSEEPPHSVASYNTQRDVEDLF